jgi:asparagine N-glycosylation enzyme membrane subunit Stt3
MAMAMVRRLAGRKRDVAVVPVLGAIAVWLTFVLGCHIGGSAAGAVAAVLMAASPPFPSIKSSNR